MTNKISEQLKYLSGKWIILQLVHDLNLCTKYILLTNDSINLSKVTNI